MFRRVRFLHQSRTRSHRALLSQYQTYWKESPVGTVDSDLRGIQRYRALPRNDDRSDEMYRWLCSLKYVFPWLAEHGHTSDFALVELMKPMEVEATRAAELASRVAAETDASRPEVATVLEEGVDAHVSDHDPIMANRLSIARLLQDSPG